MRLIQGTDINPTTSPVFLWFHSTSFRGGSIGRASALEIQWMSLVKICFETLTSPQRSSLENKFYFSLPPHPPPLFLCKRDANRFLMACQRVCRDGTLFSTMTPQHKHEFTNHASMSTVLSRVSWTSIANDEDVGDAVDETAVQSWTHRCGHTVGMRQ